MEWREQCAQKTVCNHIDTQLFMSSRIALYSGSSRRKKRILRSLKQVNPLLADVRLSVAGTKLDEYRPGQKILEALNKSSSRAASVEEKLRQSELENRYLRELLRRERIAKYGPGSKKLSDERAGAFGS
jgi:hypothetical protein